jgi:hypothetical protein
MRENRAAVEPRVEVARAALVGRDVYTRNGVLDATRRRTTIRQQAERIVGITHPDYLP